MKLRSRLRGLTAALASAPLVLVAWACSDDGGGGEGTDAGTSIGCAVDTQNRAERAAPLALGERVEGFVCPPTDVDWFRFELPAGQPLVNLALAYPTASASAVELSYTVYSASDLERPVASGEDMNPNDNRSSLMTRHYLGTAGGTYFVLVRDAGNEDDDERNAYGLRISAAADPDDNEPNETCAAATPLGTPRTGSIASREDVDAYSVEVPAGAQILDVNLTADSASPVDFSIALFDPSGALLTRESDPRGEDGPTRVQLRHGFIAPAAGRYCLVVEDDDRADADETAVYGITATRISEPDASEQTLRNDVPAAATDLGATGGMRMGYLASKADSDWYRVAARRESIVEITLDCPGCTIEPTISIIDAATGSPCDADSPCDYLLRSSECQSSATCPSGICRATTPGMPSFCAANCDDNLACASFQCQQAGGVSACVGAGVCLPEGLCGALQFTKTAAQGTRTVRTAQPSRRGLLFIRVHDFQDDAWTELPYSLNVRVVADPDAAQEPNNFYAPYTTFDPGAVLARGSASATGVPWQITADVPPRMRASGTGCIAYEGDIDLFRLQGGNPCTRLAEMTTSTVTVDHCGLTLTFDRPAGSLDLAYFFLGPDLGTRASFAASAQGGDMSFGDNICGMGGPECFFFHAGDTEDAYLEIRDFGQDDWETAPGQCYSWTITSAPMTGCPASCPDTGTNGLCLCTMN